MARIRKFGEPILRKKSEAIREFNASVLKTVADLEKALDRSETGIGLAAPQIGILKRIFTCVHPDTKKILTLINPVVVETSTTEIDMEGCLSFPEIFFSIKRFKKVTVTALSPKGRKITMEASGLLARCILHETDHLNGILIIDYATPEEQKFWKEKIEKLDTKKD